MGDTVLRLCLISALLAGCGKVANKTPDAGPADAGIDADLSGNATVVTQAALFGAKVGDKAGNIDIVSHLPNNMVLATGVTDANGNATIKVYPGGSVTAIYKHPAAVDMGADLITWVGVKPDDTLTFGSRQFSFSGQSMPLGTPTYSWPALAGATLYQVFTSCGGTSAPAAATSLTLTESNFCHRDPMDVLFRALNSNNVPVGYNFRSNVAFNPTGTVSITGWVTNVPTAMVNITGLPSEITSVFGNFFSVLDSNQEVGVNFYSGSPTGGAFTGSFAWHATGERTVGEVFLQRQGPFSTITLFDTFPSNTVSQTVAAPALLPWLQGTLTSAALHKASWFLLQEPSSTSKGEVLQLNWSRVVNNASPQWQWFIIMPPGQTSIDFPALPAPLSDHMPSLEDFVGGSMTVFDIPSVADYDMVRTLPSASLMCLRCAIDAGDFQRVLMEQF